MRDSETRKVKITHDREVFSTRRSYEDREEKLVLCYAVKIGTILRMIYCARFIIFSAWVIYILKWSNVEYIQLWRDFSETATSSSV